MDTGGLPSPGFSISISLYIIARPPIPNGHLRYSLGVFILIISTFSKVKASAALFKELSFTPFSSTWVRCDSVFNLFPRSLGPV